MKNEIQRKEKKRGSIKHCKLRITASSKAPFSSAVSSVFSLFLSVSCNFFSFPVLPAAKFQTSIRSATENATQNEYSRTVREEQTYKVTGVVCYRKVDESRYGGEEQRDASHPFSDRVAFYRRVWGFAVVLAASDSTTSSPSFPRPPPARPRASLSTLRNSLGLLSSLTSRHRW